MKKLMIKVLLPMVAIVYITGCESQDFEGVDTLVIIERELSEFTKVKVSTDVEVKVSFGDEQLVEIQVNENLQERIKTEVNEGTLIVTLASGSYSNATFKVDIKIPVLEKVIASDNTRAMVDFFTNRLEVEVGGSSSITLQGSSNTLDVVAKDDGFIGGFSFLTDTLNATASGASEMEITCEGELNGKVQQAAIVRYKGTPIINAQVSEAGRILNAN